MLNVIPMVTTKKLVVEYTQKEMRKKFRLLSVFKKTVFPGVKNNISEKGQSWRTDTAHLQDSLYSYNNPKRVILENR